MPDCTPFLGRRCAHLSEAPLRVPFPVPAYRSPVLSPAPARHDCHKHFARLRSCRRACHCVRPSASTLFLSSFSLRRATHAFSLCRTRPTASTLFLAAEGRVQCLAPTLVGAYNANTNVLTPACLNWDAAVNKFFASSDSGSEGGMLYGSEKVRDSVAPSREGPRAQDQGGRAGARAPGRWPGPSPCLPVHVDGWHCHCQLLRWRATTSSKKETKKSSDERQQQRQSCRRAFDEQQEGDDDEQPQRQSCKRSRDESLPRDTTGNLPTPETKEMRSRGRGLC